MVIALTNEEAWTLKQIDRNVDAIIRWIEKVDRLIPILMEQKSLAEKQATSEWISVKDRLPTRDDANQNYSVLAINKRDGIPGEWVYESVAIYPGEYTYWMPLPEPPEEVT